MKIEKNIPMEASAVGRPNKYPFSRMAAGDSVFIEHGQTGGKEYLAAAAIGRTHRWKFSGRKVEGGLRIWRVS